VDHHASELIRDGPAHVWSIRASKRMNCCWKVMKSRGID
jgi:hypothetical protein